MKKINYDFLNVIHFIEFFTKEEYEEAHYHYVLNDVAELVLQYGYDKVIADLGAILDSKVDKLEPVGVVYG